MSMYMMFYFMASAVKLAETSADCIVQRFQRPTVRLFDSRLVSRILNRQIKSAMHALLRTKTREVLEELDRTLKRRDQSMWGAAFCTVSILAICMEEVQIAMDGLGLHMRRQGATGNELSSSYIIGKCRELDDVLFVYLNKSFHGVYRARNIVPSKVAEDVSCPRGNVPDAGTRALKNGINELLFKYGMEVASIIHRNQR